MKGSLTKTRKYQKYLIIVFAILMIAIGVVFYQDFFLEKLKIEPKVSLPPEYFPEIKIDFQVLKSPDLKSLEPFPELPSYPGEDRVGKQNPFVR